MGIGELNFEFGNTDITGDFNKSCSCWVVKIKSELETVLEKVGAEEVEK